MTRSARKRLREQEEARATVAALVSGEVDVVAGPGGAVLLAAAEALRAANDGYRALLDSAPAAMVVFDQRGAIEMANARTAELFGYAVDGVLGLSIEALVPRGLRRVYVNGRSAYASRAGEPRVHCRRRDGSEFPAEIRLSPASTRGGRSTIAAIRDIAARLKTEDALRESEARMASTLNSIGEGVLATDLAGIVTRINPTAEKLIGCSRGEAVGRAFDQVFRALSDKTRQPLVTPIAELAAGRAAVPPHARLLTRDGRELFISQSAAPIRRTTGEVVGVVLVFRDVTAQKEMQEQLLISDHMVSLGTLAAAVAHEINNPLAALIGNMDVLNVELAAQLPPGTPLPAIVQEVLRDMREAADQVRSIVMDLKPFSRGGDDSRGPIDVQRLLDSSVRLAWNEVRHRARLIKEWLPVPPVLGNEARLAEVFVNLIANAAQAIPEGRADDNEIHVATRLDDDGRVVVEISDTGVGIPPDVQARIFNPFFTTKPAGVGTGLGLAICHRIVTELGGDISVESEPGRGSKFRVSLLAAPRDAAAPTVTAARRPSAHRRGAVLIIDDEPLLRGFMRHVLGGGYDVAVEASGGDGLGRIRDGQRFDVILCDVMMPRMTGVEFYELLSALEPAQAERVVFMTGGAFAGRTQRFLESNDNPCLYKPFGADALLALVADVVDRSPALARPPPPPEPPLSLTTPVPMKV